MSSRNPRIKFTNTSFEQIFDYFQFWCPYDAKIIKAPQPETIPDAKEQPTGYMTIAINMRWWDKIIFDICQLKPKICDRKRPVIIKFITFKEAREMEK